MTSNLSFNTLIITLLQVFRFDRVLWSHPSLRPSWGKHTDNTPGAPLTNAPHLFSYTLSRIHPDLPSDIPSDLLSNIPSDIPSDIPFHTSSYTSSCTFSCTGPATQQDVHRHVGIPIVEHILRGVSATCFAYGHTGRTDDVSLTVVTHYFFFRPTTHIFNCAHLYLCTSFYP